MRWQGMPIRLPDFCWNWKGGNFLLSIEKVTYGRYEFEVLEMDNRRILKVKFTVNRPGRTQLFFPLIFNY